jgi:hypothetical protein
MRHPVSLPLLLTLCLGGCGSSSEAGVEVKVVSAPSSLVPGQVWASVDGQELRLSELFWTTTAVELVPCDSLAQKTWDVFVPKAHAHGVASPRRLSVPIIERASRREPLVLGTLRPPAGRYCSVKYVLGSADADAVGLDTAPGMLGHSVDARGEFRTSGTEPEPFEITSRSAVQLVRPIDLELSETTPRAVVRIERDEEAWFAGIALAELDAAERELRLLDNFAASIAIFVE